jgi:hypothetical protein
MKVNGTAVKTSRLIECPLKAGTAKYSWPFVSYVVSMWSLGLVSNGAVFWGSYWYDYSSLRECNLIVEALWIV